MYKHIVLGGTFDGLHRGHTSFLARAFAVSDEVTIGLTSEAYIRRFKKGLGVAPYSKRYQMLTSWLRHNALAERAHIVPLDNKWGPAILGEFDAIAVTRDNKSAADEINMVRLERGIPILAVVKFPLVDAKDRRPISSTRVRKGVIDVFGNLRMPDSLRPELQKPLGRIIPSGEVKAALQQNRDNVVITVGDITTHTALVVGVRPALAVIDLQVERKPYQTLEDFKFPSNYSIVKLRSGPGFIAKSAIDAIVAWSATLRARKRMVLVVDGEEDLLTLPAIIHAPVGSFVYYGSPPASGEEGLVEVEVTSRMKTVAAELLGQFI
jgi:cytidyltransferase-like protein